MIQQKKKNKCSIEDGPNCFFIESKSKSQISNELKKIYPDTDSFLKESLENILLQLKEKTKLISPKEKETIDDDIFIFNVIIFNI